MSDFLKSVRNTQGRYGNKRHGNHGNHGNYEGNSGGGNYYSQERRGGNERRGQSRRDDRSSNRVEDMLTPIRRMLEQIVEGQRIQEGYMERQTIASEEMAAAFMDIAKFLDRYTEESVPPPMPAMEAPPAGGTMNLSQLTDDQLLSPADERRDAIKIMKKLRRKGATYKEIAQFLNEREIPTFSKKGNWHAQTIHRLCNQ